MTGNQTKPYHQQEDEPNIWYHRFYKFMRMGPGRSITRCYRETTNAERVRTGRPLLSDSSGCPAIWRQRARQFDWTARAEAWDAEQRQLDLKIVQHTRSLACSLSPRALQVLGNAMNGELRNPDGSLTEGQNCTQRRLAAEKILDLIGLDAEEPQYDEFQGPIQLRELRVVLTDDPDDPQEYLPREKKDP